MENAAGNSLFHPSASNSGSARDTKVSSSGPRANKRLGYPFVEKAEPIERDGGRIDSGTDPIIMKRSAGILLVVGSLAFNGSTLFSQEGASLMPPHLPREGTNLVENPGVKTLSAWSLLRDLIFDESVSRTADGSGSFRLATPLPGASMAGSDLIPVQGGKRYTYGFYFRTQNGPTFVGAQISLHDAKGTYLRNLERPGWAYVTYQYSGPDWPPFWNEVVAVKLDGSQTVERIAHLHATRTDYLTEAHAVPSPDGKRVLWSAAWDGDATGRPISAYVARLQGR